MIRVGSFLSIFATLFFSFSSFSATNSNLHFEGLDLTTGKEIKLDLDSQKKGLVLIFLSSKCPCSNSHVEEVNKLSKEFPEFQFLGVNSNAKEKIENSTTYFSNMKFNFPVIRDVHTTYANKFNALKTPHAFVLSPTEQILYKGGVTSSHNAAKADKHLLQIALSELKKGKPVSTPEGRALGCVIERESETENVWK